MLHGNERIVKHKIGQQTIIDTFSKVAFAKLYTTKTLITSEDLLNDRVCPSLKSISCLCYAPTGARNTAAEPKSHDFQLYLAINDVEHTKNTFCWPF